MKKILIIEDDKFIADIYLSKFQTEGFKVEVAENGKLGMEKLVNNPPDAVLLDLMMPEVNGLEVLKFIRSQPAIRTLPALVLSNAYAGNMAQAARDAGANKCLTKATCTPKRLVEELRSVLAAHDAALQRQAPGPVQPDAGTETVPMTGNADPNLASWRQGLQLRMTSQLKDLRLMLENLVKSDEINALPSLLKFYRGVRDLTGSAGLAGFSRIARLGSALEALINELHAKPKKLNLSSLRTVAQAVDLLGILVEQAGKPYEEMLMSPLILVVDDDLISRETVCTALEKAHLSAISLGDPAMALKLLEENRFDLVFLDVDMPGLNGFDLCKKLHASPANAKTSVVFVTALRDFETRAHSSGGTDFIAKPFLLLELAVKALVHLVYRQISPSVIDPSGTPVP